MRGSIELFNPPTPERFPERIGKKQNTIATAFCRRQQGTASTMRIPRVFCAQDLAPEKTVALDERAAKHLVTVLRLQAGARLVLFNGRGGEYEAVLETAGKRGAAARVTGHVAREVESPLRVVLGQCIARGSRMDYTLQKAVELGVAAVAPLFSERCQVKLSREKAAARLQHWEGVCISACEQCGRNRVPEVRTPMALADWLQGGAEVEPNPLRLVLDAAGDSRLSGLPAPAGTVFLLSGPEGGLTDAEIGLARRFGFTAVGLGPRILRAETAPLAALTAIQALWGDLG